MSLIESRLNSIAALAIETSLKSVTVDYINNNFINKTDVTTALNSKQNSITEAPATITLGQPDDYTCFVDSTSKGYPLFSSKDIVWSKSNNDISLNISSDFKNKYLTTTAASELYAHADEISTFETTTSILNSVYQTITGMSSYVTSGTLITYVTNGSLVTYVTSGSVANTLTSYLTINNANNTYQLLGNYQLSGNYVTDSSLFQLKGNYVTDSSLFQLKGNYVIIAFTPSTTDIVGLSSNYSPKPWVAARFPGVTVNGGVTPRAMSGLNTRTCTRTDVGVYTISWTTPHPSGAFYSIHLSTSMFGFGIYDSITSTSIRFRFINLLKALEQYSNPAVNPFDDPSEFSFMIVP